MAAGNTDLNGFFYRKIWSIYLINMQNDIRICMIYKKSRSNALMCLTIVGLAIQTTDLQATEPVSKQRPSTLFAKRWWFSPVLTVSSGAEFAKVGSSQTLSMNGDFTTYQYASSGSSSNQAFWGGFLGTEISLQQQRFLQLGISFYAPNSFSSGTGILTQGVDPASSDQFTYHYKVKNRLFLAEAKLLGKVKEHLHPYVSLGLGAAFNQAYAYTTNVPFSLTFTPEFTNHSTTSFAYSVGVGIDVDIHQNWRLGAGYRFVGLGQANLGNGLIDTTSFTSTLTQSNLYAQTVMAQLTYLFPEGSQNDKK